jgi:type II secretory pathway pseudopilin PulG
MNPELQNKTGITLVEMIIVVAVIAMLAAMLVGVSTVIDTQSKEKATEATLTLLEGALDEYKDLMGEFPIQAEVDDTNALSHSEYLYYKLNSIPASRNIMKKINDKLIQNKYEPTVDPNAYEIYDPWGTVLNYVYEPNKTYPLLESAGKDKKFDTPDDITNR